MARDCAEGGHAVKGKGPLYLPPLAGHEAGTVSVHTGGENLRRHGRDDDYRRYKDRALYFNGTGRTIDGLVGMVFRRPPVVEAPSGAEELLADIDLMGRSVQSFAKALLRDVLTPGRVGVLVDHTTPDAVERRPYLRMYYAEDILDVVEAVVGGAVVPVQVRLREVFEQPVPGEEFESEQVEQVRVLEMAEGRYQQRIFRRLKDGEEMVVVVTIVPTIDGAPIDAIPFWTFSADEGGRPGKIEPPPLLDLCEVNLAHYRQEADYRNALHLAGVPTLFVSGVRNEGQEMKVGSAEVQFLEPPDAKAYYVSYGAEGARAIREALDDLQQMMAFLGARMLQPEKRGVEAAETAAIHRQGEISVLASIANGINAKLTAAFKFMLRWALFENVEDAKVELNDDFIPTQANPQMLTAMVAAWQEGLISHDTLWHFAQIGELVDPRRTAEEERELIAEENEAKLTEQKRLMDAGLMMPPPPPGGTEPDMVGGEEQATMPEAAE